jgi:hypothetical protein
MPTALRPLALLLALASAGCVVNATAPRPAPNVLAKAKVPGRFDIDVSAVPQEEICSNTSGLKPFCVQRFRGAFQEGLTDVMAAFVQPGPGHSYRASFRLVEFTHQPTTATVPNTAVTVMLAAKWQFTLVDETGRSLVALAERTEGPKPIAYMWDDDVTVGALVNAVLERIGQGLNEVQLAPAGAARPAPVLPGAPARPMPR